MKLDAPLLVQDLARAGEEAARLEAQGFDGVVGLEGPHDPFVPLIVAAGATERVRLITGIAVAFARNPMTCAYLANDVHLASRGRFTLGLGTQVRAHIERRFGQPWSRPDARMREFVEAIRAIWRSWETGERLQFRGEFYSHTLMPPLFNPGPDPFGWPPIVLAGFGPAMIRVAGEVADGWIAHPLHTPEFLHHVSLPALDAGLAAAGRSRADCEISVQAIVMIGKDDAQIAKARDGGRAQMAFYASTPAYRGVLDHHGWGDVQPILHRLSKQGRWLEMLAHIDDEMLDRIGISGTPAEAGARLRERYSFASRAAAIVYDETGDAQAVGELVSAAKCA